MRFSSLLVLVVCVSVILKSVELKVLMERSWGHPFKEIQAVLLVLLLMLFERVCDVKRMPSEASVLLVKISAKVVSFGSDKCLMRTFLMLIIMFGVMSGLNPVMISELFSCCQYEAVGLPSSGILMCVWQEYI